MARARQYPTSPALCKPTVTVPMTLSPRNETTRRWWIVAAALVGIAACDTRTRDVQDAPPRLSGTVWRAASNGETLVVYLTREERSTGPALSDEPSVHTNPYSRVVLTVRRVPDDSVVHSLPLGDIKRGDDNHLPSIIGIVGDVVWLWRGELEARRLSDLSIIASLRTLAGKGAESQSDPLPGELAAYAIAPEPPTLIARGKDARFYAIDAATSSVTPFDPATLPATGYGRIDDRFNALVPPGRARGFAQPHDVMQRSFLTSTGQWYALLSESERGSVTRWPRGEDHPTGQVARSLYRTGYRMDDRRQPEIDPGRLTQIGGARLIQAGFLVRGPGAVWDVADPSSSLVLAKGELGTASPWEVVRLARDGSVVWRTSTGMAHPSALLDLGSHVAFLESAAGSERLVWIDTRSGESRTVSLR